MNKGVGVMRDSARLTYLSVYDRRDGSSESTPSPSGPSSFTHEHRCIGSHNPNWHTVPNSMRLTYLSVYDIRDDVSESVPSPSQPSSLTHVHNIQSHPHSPHSHDPHVHVHSGQVLKLEEILKF
jgi:hypothetical protein